MLQTIAFPPASKPEDCWEWLPPARVIEIVLTAYRAAQVDIETYPERAQLDPLSAEARAEAEAEGVFWADRADFYETLLQELEARLEGFVQWRFSKPGMPAAEILSNARLSNCQILAANEAR